ncbi:MAG TPA: SIS domain-containing protein [Acidimicrobiales bacterium]|nr:SIS domain-containing protein [Acidimicrobiales bacterium]
MCGIIAVARRPGTRVAPARREVADPLQGAVEALGGGEPLVSACHRAADLVTTADALLRRAEGTWLLVHDRGLLAEVEGLCATLTAAVAAVEARLDAGTGDGGPVPGTVPVVVATGVVPPGPATSGLVGPPTVAPAHVEVPDPHHVEAVNAAVVRLKDAVWCVREDRLRTARAVADLAGSEPGWAAVEAYTSIQQALSALDRLEVRGRDSAGLHVLVRGHGLDLSGPAVAGLLGGRSADPLFRSGTVRAVDGSLSFVYKAAAEIGELGDNTRALRDAIRADDLLRLALSHDGAVAVVLGHTRWASVGIVSQPNAHPLDSAEEGTGDTPFVVAALNGDVDNFGDLKALDGLRIAPEITTDAKVIPTLVARRAAAGADLASAFRDTAAALEGSVAVAASASADPHRLLLALRGSGQALYVGVADDAYVVASEPYGVVELTSRYLRMDGETPANPANPSASRGQIVVLDGREAGTLGGVARSAYDGTPLPVGEDDLVEAHITTRDIDRGEFSHYLLKEITESPASFRKTLRGKLVERDGRLEVALGPEALPADVLSGLRSGAIHRVVVVGQGTAAVAGQALAAALARSTAETALRVEAQPATELSGFGLRSSMADTLVVAISQSGTTTDTNRTVDLVRSRGAKVVAIVNRRGSDLTDKADGVLYTSDGRDVEMSVASTKAFYSQIAAGLLLAVAISGEVGGEVDQALLAELRRLPAAMTRVLGERPSIAEAAHRLAPAERHWAVVGNGVNRIAAAEVRIKLSELCYKSIASDATEDKKHVDLSSEPLIVVCAAGLEGSTADDVAKEVAIYRAHKASPVVIATEGQSRFASALHVISVPETHPDLAFVLSAMAGHLFGYEAALAIDALARPLRAARAAIEGVIAGDARGAPMALGAATVPPGSFVPAPAAPRPGGPAAPPLDGEALLRRLRPEIEAPARAYLDGLRVGAYDGQLDASSAVRLASLLRYVLGVVPLDAYQLDQGKVGTPAVVIDDLTAALTQGIEELTRPVDAIKHQAKTVTVGISRTDETLLQVPLVHEVMATGAHRDQLTYSTLRTLADISPAVVAVVGYTRYRVEGRVGDEGATSATATVVDRGGIARDLASRVERHPELRGTKHRVAREREVLVARGRRDGRPIVIVPQVKDGEPTGIVLLHVSFADHLPEATARGVLQGYRNRYAVLRDAVLETEPTFREDLLAGIPVEVLLTEPINQLADRWRT